VRASRLELIDDPERFQRLRQEWTALLGDSSADCLFLTWEWLYTWWKHLADGRDLCLLAMRDGGDLTGLAPFAVSPWRVTRLRLFRALEFLGTGSVGSDYLDVISRRSREQDVAEALADYLTRRGTILELAHIQADSSLTSAVAARVAGRDWTGAAIRTEVCPFVRLSGHSWESYLATLGPAHRYNIRRRLQNLTRQFDLRFERATTEAQRRAALAEIVTLHHRRWQTRGGSTAFRTPALLAFHEEFSQLALERGWLRLFVLRLDGRPASALYGFRYKGRFYFYQSGFEPEYSKYSVGLVTMALTVKSAIDEGAEEYDFLRGDEPYKFHWAQGVRELHRLELYPPRLSSWLCRGAVETGRVARRLARRVLSRTAPHVPARGRQQGIATPSRDATAR
jgi:CelD/BcsL family acetyltransferase involved in cellulose biosynthesis